WGFGWQGLVLLFAFFLSGSFLTQFAERRAPRRTARQVVANGGDLAGSAPGDRKSTRLNSSHGSISYAVFCLKKKIRHSELHPLLQRLIETALFASPHTPPHHRALADGNLRSLLTVFGRGYDRGLSPKTC